MENQKENLVNLCFVAVAILVGFIVHAGVVFLLSRFALESKLTFVNIEIFKNGLAVLFGLAAFFALYFNGSANQFTYEVIEELAKVSWPTQNETVRATVVVFGMVIFSAIVLGAFDAFWTWLVGLVI
jgi:preprotein translocase SecE subunit